MGNRSRWDLSSDGIGDLSSGEFDLEQSFYLLDIICKNESHDIIV